MTLAPGARVGHYEIVGPLGSGGMGEVYRATDLHLKRQVAIKILPDSFAADPARVARFQREAEVLASLNHPHIAAIYGFEEGHILVMELVEGPTLAEMLDGFVGLPIDEALRIGRQIAEALEVAHDQGIVHRDLKPANVKVRPDGAVKVLDFGLAKIAEAGRAGVAGPGGDATHSPTITSPAFTHAGMILGTAAYMAPEQAAGKPTDRRADIWAFGVVLWEMLTGRGLFRGETVSHTLADVLRAPIDLTALPKDTPGSIRTLLTRCLDRDITTRLRDVGEARIVIQRYLANPSSDAPLAADAAPLPVQRSRWGAAATIGAVVVASLVTGASVWWARRPVEQPRPIARFSIELPGVTQAGLGSAALRNQVAISPDGTRLAFAASQRLYLRDLSQFEAQVPGIEAGGIGGQPRVPFFSPDGRSLGYWQQGQLKKLAIGAGTSIAICDALSTPTGAFWGPDDRIIWAHGGGPGGASAILEVASGGGTATELVTFERGEVASSPQVLPGGEWVLFVLHAANATAPQGRVVVLSRKSRERRTLVEGVITAAYLPGYLLLGRGNGLQAQPFDASSLSLIGSPAPVLDGLAQNPNSPFLQFAVSASGTLAYMPGSGMLNTVATRLVAVARTGQASTLADIAGMTWYPRFSPDGSRVAYGMSIGNSLVDDSDLWVLDVARGARTRVTFKANNRFYPLWTRDGLRLTFSDGTGDTNRLLSAPADGSGVVDVLADTGPRRYATSWSPDGTTLALYMGGNSSTGSGVVTRDLWMMSRAHDKWTVTPFVQTPFEERGAIFSPSGKWVAYVSDKSGQNDIYARPYPGPGSEVTISVGGGQEPVWGHSGQELFYRHDRKLFVVKVAETASSLTVSSPARVFDDPYRLDTGGSSGGMANYDVSPDGQRFVMVEEPAPAGGATTAPVRLNVVLNWQDEIKRRLPTP